MEGVAAVRYLHGQKLKPGTETEIPESIDLTSVDCPPEPSVTDPTTTASAVLLPKGFHHGAFLLNRDGPFAIYPVPSQVIDDCCGTGLIDHDPRIGHSL